MAGIIGGIGTSHVPTIAKKPDVLFFCFNDHATDRAAGGERPAAPAAQAGSMLHPEALVATRTTRASTSLPLSPSLKPPMLASAWPRPARALILHNPGILTIPGFVLMTTLSM